MGSKVVGAASVDNFARHAIRVSLRMVIRLLAQSTRRKSGNAKRTHQLRTATRRADAALRLLRDWLPRRRQQSMRKLIGEIRESAGAVRDLDVLIQRLPWLADQLPPETLSWLQEHAASRRTTSVRSLRRYGRGQPMKTLQDHSRSLRHRIRWRGDAESPKLNELGTETLGRLAEKYSSALQALGGDGEPSQLVRRCHMVRIAGRRLRYTLELLQDAIPVARFELACERLAKLQDTLGEVNDQNTALGRLRGWLVDCNDEDCRLSLHKLIDPETDAIAARVAAIIAEISPAAEQVLNLLRQFPATSSGKAST